MATTASPLWPGASTFPNTNVYGGQGVAPIMRARYSTDDLSVATPTWTEVPAARLLGFTITRGRDSELSDFDAGTATIALDNRTRTYDPNNNALIRPLNRWWLYEEFSGEVHSCFKGYAQSYTLAYPGGGWSGAVTTVQCSDEFLILSQAALPTTNPPCASYADLINVDNPVGYWDMNDDPTKRQFIAVETALPEPIVHRGLIEFRRADLRRAIPGTRRKRP